MNEISRSAKTTPQVKTNYNGLISPFLEVSFEKFFHNHMKNYIYRPRSFAAPSVDFRFYLYFEFCIDGPFKETKEHVLSF